MPPPKVRLPTIGPTLASLNINGDLCRTADHVFEIAEHILFRFNRLAIDLEQIIALANIDSRLIKRGSK